MPEPGSLKGVFLIAPAYRRWLTSDASDLRLQLIGYTPEELKSKQLRAAITDAESDSTDHKLYGVDPEETLMVLAVPRFHSGGELLIYLEDEKTEKLVLEARWHLSKIANDFLADAVYFDARNVVIRNQKAYFPRAWAPAAADELLSNPAPLLDRMKTVGFNTLAATAPGLAAAKVAELAAACEERGLSIIASAVPDGVEGPGLAKACELRVRELRGIPNLLAYEIAILPTVDAATTLAVYQAVRRSDPKHPVLLRLAKDDGWNSIDPGFEDVALLDVPGKGQPATAWDRIEQLGLVRFGRIKVDAEGGVSPEAKLARQRFEFYDQLIRGASGAIWAGDNASLNDPAVEKTLAEAKKVEDVFLRGLNTRWPVAKEARAKLTEQDHRVWQRRASREFILIALQHGEQARQISVPVPPNVDKLFVLGENRTLPVKDGHAVDDFQPWTARVYTNIQDL